MAMTYDEYDSKRSWLVDTAETPADQKRLKAQLEKLRSQYESGKAKATPLTGAAAVKEAQRQVSPKGVAQAEAQARAAIEKQYPGLYIPEVKKGGKMLTPDLARSKNKNFGR
jgi:hypothetical protein